MIIFTYSWLFQEQNQEWDRQRQLLKGANNHATHDAVQLAKRDSVTDGLLVLDEHNAYGLFLDTIQLNLGLDHSLNPKAGSPLNDEVRIVFFDIIDETTVEFPYLYENETYRIAKHLNGPAVVAVIETEHPQLIKSKDLAPIRVAAIHEYVGHD